MKVSASLKELAKLGDAIVNFTVSAALTLRDGRPWGVKVPDSVLRAVSKRVGIRSLGALKPEDVLEAVIAYAWLKGFSVEEMVKITLRGMEKGGVEDGLAILTQHLSPYVRELLALRGESRV
ncbi:MAG: ribonuclease III family protein [Thermofilaceae archaeon]